MSTKTDRLLDKLEEVFKTTSDMYEALQDVLSHPTKTLHIEKGAESQAEDLLVAMNEYLVELEFFLQIMGRYV